MNSINQLAALSFSAGKLDPKRVSKISTRLSKTNLRSYIKALKMLINKNSVKIFVSTKLDKKFTNELKEIFKDKNVQIELDKTLIAGIKIKDYDTIYDFNLKNSFKSMLDGIKSI